MENKFTLSEIQIEHLFAFVKKKIGNDYDMQVELVDHLTGLIEANMEANPTHDFETALNKVYAGFGIFGISNHLNERAIATQKNERRLWWQHFKALFGWPAALVSIVIAFGLFFLLKFLGFIFTLWFLVALALLITIKMAKQNRTQKSIVTVVEFGRKMFFTSCFVTITQAIFQSLLSWNSTENYDNSPWAFLPILVILLYNLATLKVYLQLLNNAKGNYPLAFK